MFLLATSQSNDIEKMDVLSAATETVANADAIEAAALKVSKLPTGPAANASATAEASAGADTAAVAAAAESSEIEMDVDEHEGAAPPRSKDSGAAQPPAVPPAVRAAHERLLKNAEDIKSGT